MRHWLVATFLFLALFGSKLVIIDRFGSDLPYWDQWDAEGRYNFLPYVERGEFWRGLFTPTNEHRILPTRLLSLGLFRAGGQWDARVQVVANAALHAALVAAFLLWLARFIRFGWMLATALFLCGVIAPGIMWENVVAGFQSQFYFLLGFSFATLVLILSSRALTAKWWIGAASAAVAIVTMGSGAICAVAIGAIALMRLVYQKHDRRDALITFGLCLAVLGIGVWQRPSAPQCEPIYAHSLSQFFTYAARCLSWPLPERPWLAGFFWLPWLVLAWRWVKGRASDQHPAVDLVVAGGLWVLLQTAAVSYARGSGLIMPGNRYGEITGLGIALSFASLALFARWRPTRRYPLWAVAYAALALGAVGIKASATWRHEYPEKKSAMSKSERLVATFLLTDNEAILEQNQNDLPYPEWKWLRDFLRHPGVADWLPGSVRRPLLLPDFSAPPPDDPAPPLAFRRTRTVRTGQTWTSSVLPVSKGWWKIETAGSLGLPGTTLQLVADGDGRVLGEIVASRVPGMTWRAAYVAAPSVPARIVARAGPAAPWFAFSEPVEVARLSYSAWRLSKQGVWMTIAGLAGLIGLAVFAFHTRRATDSVVRPSPA